MGQQKQNVKTMLKGTFSNRVHELLEQGMDKKLNERWRSKVKLTDAQKLEIFEKIEQLHTDCSNAIRSVRFEKWATKRKNKLRLENGYVAKKKTTYAEWLKMQEQMNVA